MAEFRDKMMQDLYVACRTCGVIVTSEFYHNSTIPRRGAAHRTAYWKGRAGEPLPKYIDRTSLSYAAFKAGRDERKVDVRKGNAMPAWTMPHNYPVPPAGWSHK